ncbi:hypothetical protein [Nannocystis punicea]|uniref:Uncharacterized protein n=1 Tax=Nannocystis punicea TaxID=2995304 RepID=A0ABY7H8N6_9BACT|nr:hypothetical protein [Nannocystis poenicansa]WAS95450.1 hypothetical protein O0S08_04755 [Nannocystis poenicansa]
MHLRTLSCAMSVSFLFACGADKSDSATEASGADDGTALTGGTYDPTEAPDTTANSVTMPPDTDTTGDEPLDPACACLADEATCGAELCAGAGLNCEETCPDDQPVEDEAALQCALEALRDRTPGRISWYYREFFGQWAYNTQVYIQADGNAIVTQSGGMDLCDYSGPDTRHSLEEPAYFEACLALATSRERYDCLTEGLADELVVCVPEAQSCES